MQTKNDKRPMQDWYEEKVCEVLNRGGVILDGSHKIITMPHGYYNGEVVDIAPSILTKCAQYNNVVLEPIEES